MATRFYCDRCGDLVDSKDKIAAVSYPLITGNPYYVNLEDANMKSTELCKSCIVQLIEFMKPMPRKQD